MIRNFIEKFGEAEKIVLVVGDWDQGNQMKYKEPTKGIGLRKTFRKYGIETYLGKEAYTSCTCSKCEGECETFRECKNPRWWRAGKKIIRHGLVRCATCKCLWNRDENGACNIYKVAKAAINGEPRPPYLCPK
jgi:hypothetical protein